MYVGIAEAICLPVAGTVIRMLKSVVHMYINIRIKTHHSIFHGPHTYVRTYVRTVAHCSLLTDTVQYVCEEHTWLMGTGESRGL